MKLGRTALTNTDKVLLHLLRVRGAMTVRQMVAVRYPQSRQVDKKAATFSKTLRSLQRRGLVRECRGVWLIP